jgi:hypothetical protein
MASSKETTVRHPFRGASLVLAGAGLAGLGACVSLESPAVSPTCGTAGTLTIGAALSDAITSNSCRLSDLTYANFYKFRVDSPSQLAVSLTSAAAATTWITDSAGALVANSAFNESAATTQSLRLIVKPGPYQLAVNSFATQPSGALTVTVAKDTTPVSGSQTAVWVTDSIATTQTITSGDHSDGPYGTRYYYHLYLRWVQGGSQLSLSEHSTAFDPQVVITSVNSGSAVGVSVLDSTNTTAVVSYSPGATDVLLLWVGSRDSLQAGKYSLTIK